MGDKKVSFGEGNIIEFHNVFKSFGSKRIFFDVSFQIKRGEIVGLFGSSGSGKSVLMKLLIGLIKPSSGRVFKFGGSGISFQNNSLYEQLTVMQNINFFASVYKVKISNEFVSNLLNWLELKEYGNTIVKNLSGGTQKRVDIACALISDPDVLVLDEPFNGLDYPLIRKLIELLKSLNSKGKTIIVSSHITYMMPELCDRGFVVKNECVKEVALDKLEENY